MVRSVVEGTTDPATGWRRIDSTQHGFSVLMPGAVQLESRQAQVQPFPLNHYIYIYQTDDSFYSVEIFGDYPPNFHSTPNSFEVALDLTFYSMKKNLEPLGFTLTELRKLQVGTFPGREYTLSNFSWPLPGRAQVFVSPKRTYIFVAMEKKQENA